MLLVLSAVVAWGRVIESKVIGSHAWRKAMARIPTPAKPVLWFVQPYLLVLGQVLLDDFQLLKSIFEHGLFRIFLSDTNRRQQDSFCGQSAVRHLRPTRHFFVPSEFHGRFSRGPGLISEPL